jgi:hypothetical protein
VIRRTLSALCALVLITLGSAAAADSLSPKPQGAEVAFVQSISKDLNARFPTPADAEKAGYFRYTNEDDTGAISYTNLTWQTASDPQHPSQLWYSAGGKLLGADFSVPYTSSTPPSLWGVNPKRWEDFPAHVHFVLDENGKMVYTATSVKKFKAAGGDVENPQAATAVKLGKAKSVSEVKHIFFFPHIWDLIVWVTPNPNGAFADKNPLVHPTMNAEKDSM